MIPLYMKCPICEYPLVGENTELLPDEEKHPMAQMKGKYVVDVDYDGELEYTDGPGDSLYM